MNIKFIKKIKIKKKWLILIAIILIIVGYFVVSNFLKSPVEGYVTEKIVRGEVLQEVSETGSVKATEDISLSFKTTGRISKMNVAVGDNVKKGDVLAELDSNQIFSQLKNAEAALTSARSQYDKLINGSTAEDIKVYEDAVSSAQHDLKSAYDSAINTLTDAYNKIYNSYAATILIQNTYFTGNDQESTRVRDSINDISSNMQNAKIYLDTAKRTSNSQDIDGAISQMLLVLSNVYNDLKVIREQCDNGIYYLNVSSADKTTLDTQRGYINTVAGSATDSQKSINSYKIALQKAKDNLTFKTANARPEDISIYEAQISQAEANVNLYQSQLSDNSLRSPIDAKITQVNAKRGETTPSGALIKLLSLEPFQIKVDIYEQDIVNVKIGDSVKINLVAFPKQTFSGKVLSIDPGEKIVDNVVYYQTTIDFPLQPSLIRSGMTADIVIQTNKKENVLRAPKNAVENIDGQDTVQVVNNGKIENRQITVGMEGNDFYEIVSGLSEGEEIITGKK